MSDLDEFTEEIRDFLNRKLTPELRHFGEAFPGFDCPRPVAEEWTRILDDQGWSVPAWPVEHGGTGWSAEQLMIFKREVTLAHAPKMAVQGVVMVGPVVIEFGTDEQKEAILPRIRSGEGLVGPGLFRAGRWVRSGLIEVPGSARWRRLRHQRDENLDHLRTSVQQDLLSGAHK